MVTCLETASVLRLTHSGCCLGGRTLKGGNDDISSAEKAPAGESNQAAGAEGDGLLAEDLDLPAVPLLDVDVHLLYGLGPLLGTHGGEAADIDSLFRQALPHSRGQHG